MTRQDDTFKALREKADELLQAKDGQYKSHLDIDHTGNDLKKLIHEVNLYDVELTMQNKELMQTQIELRQSNKRFEILFDALPVAAIAVDITGVIIQANVSAARIFNFRALSYMINHSLLRLISSKDRNTVYNAISNAEVDHHTRLTPVMLATDEHLLVDLDITLLPDNYRDDKHLLITITDCTMHYLQQKKQVLLKTLIDNSDARIFAFDRKNRCVFANAKELEFIKLPVEKVLGYQRDLWMDHEEALAMERQDALVLATGQSYLYEERKQRDNDKDQYFLKHKFPLRGKDGIFGVGCIATEITLDKERRERLNLAMFAFSMGQEGILITDTDNKIISINSAFNKITGYTESEVLGKDPKILASGRHDKAFYQRMWSELLHKDSWEGEIWNRRKDGSIYPQWLSISRINTGGNGSAPNFIGIFSDITKRKMAEEEIEYLAFYDMLTGLPNRSLLANRVNQLIRSSHRNQSGFSLIFFDLDHFKQINDVHGHAAGDEVLKEVAQRTGQLIREKDTLSRLGGDEFVLLLNDIEVDNIRSRLLQILKAVTKPYQFKKQNLSVSASFGIAIYPSDGENFEELLKNADTAMYAAKENGRNTLEFFNRKMASEAKYQLDMETALRDAIENNEFSLVYQPQIELETKTVFGYEALIRWNSARVGTVSPAIFIPIAEHSGHIKEIGDWVLNQATDFLLRINRYNPKLKIAINISAKQFESHEFISHLGAIIHNKNINAANLELEITETMIMKNPEKATRIMQELKSLGLRLSLDDFGTGYSSMAYLRWMPIDIIKLDQSFVTDIGKDNNADIISQSIISLAHSLGLQTIAEGVETEEVSTFLLSKDCDNAQGYLFSKPISADEVIAQLEQQSG